MESAAGPPGVRHAGGRTPKGGALSSAILYVAIVAIWAGVLIPRWLRRDSAASSSSEQDGDDLTTAEPDSDDLTTAEPDSVADEEPAPRSRREMAPAARATARTSGGPEARAERRPEARAERRPEARAERRPEMPEARREAPPRGEPRGSERDQEDKRVRAARRRLLGLLLVLAIGSGTLAFTKLAAWWVVVPPSVMLLGYLALLREAAKADAERRELARTSAARARSSAASPTAASPIAGPAPAIARPAPAPARAPAPAPDAEVIDISASLGPAGEEFYDQYADAKLRAVGDLARALAS